MEPIMQDTINSQIPAASPVEDAECAARLAGMWTESDQHPHYPCNTSTVCELLTSGGGYDIDVETLETWARTRQVGSENH